MMAPSARGMLARNAPAVVRRLATRRASAAAEAELERIVSGPRPLIAGPWTSEVGFELLYWIPLLRRVLGEQGVPPEDVIAVSRGGVASWYDGVAAGYVELLDRARPDELAGLRLRRRRLAGSEKQATELPEERALVEAAARERGLERYGLLHPSLMYRLFERAWSWDGDVDAVLARTEHARLAAPEPGELARLLPEGPFVAVKAYFSELALPDDETGRRGLDALLAGLAERLPVVLLGSPVALDEHVHHLPGRFVVLQEELEPARNLAQQSAVAVRAAALVATYGGFSYLGPHLGVPTLAVEGRSAYNAFHLRFFREVLVRLGKPPFTGPVPLADAEPSLLRLEERPA